MARTGRVGEFELIGAIDELVRDGGLRRGVSLGIGDDAAVLETGSKTVMSTDSLVEGVHFRSDWLSPKQLGARAFLVAASDLAAMGAVSRYVLLGLTIPPGFRRSSVLGIAAGLIAAAADSATTLVGGNISAGPALALTLTVVGAPGPRVLTRSGARRGDLIVVTGVLGDAAAGVEQLIAGKRRGPLIDRYRMPPSRLRLAARVARGRDVTAALDLSDGLGGDLAHLCRASRVGARVDTDKIPLSKSLSAYARRQRTCPPWAYAMRGEDYELLMTVGNGEAGLRRVVRACKRDSVVVTPIGVIDSDRRSSGVRDLDGRPLSGGWDHFAD